MAGSKLFFRLAPKREHLPKSQACDPPARDIFRTDGHAKIGLSTIAFATTLECGAGFTTP
jgi:hypothetical protein